MTAPWTVVSSLLQVVARHLQAYATVAAQDAALAITDLQHRLLALQLAAVAGASCLLLGIAWIAGITWNTPWRNPALAAMLVVLATGCIVGARLALRPHPPGRQPFARLRTELFTDKSLLGQLSPEGSPRQSRREPQALVRQQPADRPGTFPRSTIMRLLLNVAGLGGIARHFGSRVPHK